LTGGIFLRLVRTNMIGTLEMQYIESARSRGVAEARLTTRHGLRPALIPIITVMGMQIAMMLGGAELTETTFEWNGLGYMLAEYMNARDYVAVQGIVMMLAVIVAIYNCLDDVVAALIDPRVRYWHDALEPRPPGRGRRRRPRSRRGIHPRRRPGPFLLDPAPAGHLAPARQRRAAARHAHHRA